MGSSIELMKGLASDDLDYCELAACRALSAVGSYVHELDWVPLVVFSGQNLAALRKLVRIAMGAEAARELSSNLAWEDDAAEKLAIRTAIGALAELSFHARFEALWRRCLVEACHEYLSTERQKIASLLGRGVGGVGERRALMSALLEFHVPENDLDLRDWAARAYSEHEKLVLIEGPDDSTSSAGGAVRL